MTYRDRLPSLLKWSTGGVAAVLLVLTGYAMLSGESTPSTSGSPATATGMPSPASTYYGAPADWSEPERWAVLPRGARTDKQGNEVGFPHTTEGAVGMLAAANTTEVTAAHSHVDVQLGVYASYLIAADRTEDNKTKIEQAGAESDAKMRRSMGLPEDGAPPPGTYARNHVVGFQVIQASPSEAAVWLLSRVTTRKGEMETEEGAYTCTLVAAEWDGTDWRLSAASTEDTLRRHGRDQSPPIAAPGDPAFNSGGWTAIRAAS
ncbi:hypothetical protein GT018_17510 [Streptomyces sp. SID4912]|nr:hypothetical protein [Streptomyces sp. SID4912]